MSNNIFNSPIAFHSISSTDIGSIVMPKLKILNSSVEVPYMFNPITQIESEEWLVTDDDYGLPIGIIGVTGHPGNPGTPGGWGYYFEIVCEEWLDGE